jgi:hypothetical protein
MCREGWDLGGGNEKGEGEKRPSAIRGVLMGLKKTGARRTRARSAAKYHKLTMFLSLLAKISTFLRTKIFPFLIHNLYV